MVSNQVIKEEENYIIFVGGLNLDNLCYIN